MAGFVCKAAINSLTRAIMHDWLANIFTSPLVRDVMIPASECDQYLDELFYMEYRIFNEVGYAGRSPMRIVEELVNRGVLVPEIWTILAKPTEPGANPVPGDTT